jgi:hypothetical protein
MTEGTEIDTIEETAGDVAIIIPERKAAYDLLSGSIAGTTDLMENYDSEEVQRALALGLLGSETSEEVFGENSKIAAWSELLGIPCEVQDVHFNPSKTEGGPGFYAVVRVATLTDGEVSTRHIGGYRPCAQLLWQWSRGLVPFNAKVVEIGAARSGQSAPLGLELV